MPDIPAGRLAVEVTADMRKLDRQLKTELRAKAKQAGSDAGKAVSDSWVDEVVAARRKMGLAGRKAGRDMGAALTHAFNREIADAREELFRGLIDEREFERRSRKAARSFNKGILDEIKRQSLSGQITDQEFVRLTGLLKDEGLRGGREWGRGVARGARGPLGGLRGWVRNVWAVGIVGALLFVGAQAARIFRRIARGIRNTLQRAGEIQAARTAFENLTTARGISPGETLQSLRSAARGTVNDLELMVRANFALQAGLPATADSLGEILNISRRLGKSLGRDTADSFRRLTEAVAKGERRILDELGIVVNFDKAHRDLATRLGKTTQELTEQEKAAERLNVVLAAGRRRLVELGPEQFTAAERLEQMGTAFRNLGNAIALGFAGVPVVERLLEGLGGTAEDVSRRIERAAIAIGARLDFLFSLSGLRAFGQLAIGDVGGAFATTRRSVGEATARREREFEQRQRVLAIQGEQSLTALALRRESLKRRLRVLDADAVDHAQTLSEIHQQLEAIQRQEVKLQNQAADAAQRAAEAARARAEAARKMFRELTGVDDEAAFAMAFGGAPGVHQRDLDALRDRMLEAVREFREAARGGGFLALPEGVDRLTDEESGRRTRVQAFLDEMERLRDLDAAAEAEAVAAAFRKWEINLEDLPPHVRAIVEAILAAGDAADGAGDSLASIFEKASEFEGFARGLLSIADALGDVDDDLRRVLQGVIDLADAFGELKFKQGGGLDIVGSLPALAQGVGGLIGIGAGLIGGIFGESPEEQRRREIIERNTRALKDLTRATEALAALRDISSQGFVATRGVLAGISPDAFDRALRSGSPLEEVRRTSALIDEFVDAMAAAGLEIEDFERVAEDLGLELDRSDPRTFVENLRQLREALLDLSVERAFESFAGQLELMRTELALLDEEDPLVALERMREIFLEFTELPSDIRSQLAGIDLSTPEGRARFDELIRRLFQDLGPLFEAGAFGELTLDEVRQALEDLEGTLDELGEQAGESRSVQEVRQITEVTGNRLAAELSTQTRTGEQTFELLRQWHDEWRGMKPIRPRDVVPASSMSGGGIVIQGGIHVDTHIDTHASVSDPAALADRISSDTVRKLDQALFERIQRKARARGVSAEDIL